MWHKDGWRMLLGIGTSLLQTDTIKRTFILNMPRPVVKIPQAKIKANKSLIFLDKVLHTCTKWLQNWYRIYKELKKHIKQIEGTSLQKYCKSQPQKFGCLDEKKSCKCKYLNHKCYRKIRTWKPYKDSKSVISKNDNTLKKMRNVSSMTGKDILQEIAKERGRL